jgi:hypothetical protein
MKTAMHCRTDLILYNQKRAARYNHVIFYFEIANSTTRLKSTESYEVKEREH